ncbi:MAG: hypothetical protein JWM68_5869 [Verrucomicrobiales bacterium]|nr:hypothetical protein [Verrucomicrobiales bacterium]
MLFLTVASAKAIDTVPTKLSLRIEGFLGASYRVDLIEGTNAVRYMMNPQTFTSQPGTKEQKLTIPKQRWIAFRKRLDDANIWKWEKSYRQKGVVDGTVWQVLIEWDGRKADSSGANAYPNAKQFSIYKAAVSELLGGKKFE